ncbi:MAG TPA: cupin domain-containing protein [Iamia sp.]
MPAPLDAAAVIAALGLKPHPEGGWFAETWRDAPADGSRGAGTAIYFLLDADQVSHWHRIDAVETWHHYAGGPLDLMIAPDATGPVATTRLGPDLAGGQRPQGIVPAGAWQAARPVDGPVLVGCTVAPAFEFAHFELAPAGWSPDPSPNR